MFRKTLILLLTVPALFCACKKGTIVSGRVVNARTGDAIPGSTVTVKFQRLDANYNWVDGGRGTVPAGPRGEFSVANPRLGGRFVVYAEHDGYYPNHDYLPARQLERHTLRMDYIVEIKLVAIVSPKPLPQGEGEVRFSLPGRRTGWSFARGEMVPEAAADFVGEPDEAGQKVVILAARGRGGFYRVRGLSGEWTLYNMPEAPADGYVQQVDLREVTGDGEHACYYVRTADGGRYAKIDVGGVTKSREFVGLRFNWVYQPNGSRDLEIPLKP